MRPLLRMAFESIKPCQLRLAPSLWLAPYVKDSACPPPSKACRWPCSFFYAWLNCSTILHKEKLLIVRVKCYTGDNTNDMDVGPLWDGGETFAG